MVSGLVNVKPQSVEGKKHQHSTLHAKVTKGKKGELLKLQQTTVAVSITAVLRHRPVDNSVLS